MAMKHTEAQLISVFIVLMSVTAQSNNIYAETPVTYNDEFKKLFCNQIEQQPMLQLKENVLLQGNTVLECALECSKHEACEYFVLTNTTCGLLISTNGTNVEGATITAHDVIYKKFTGI